MRTTLEPLARAAATVAPERAARPQQHQDPRHAAVLQLQRTAGNRATRQVVAREIRKIQGESVYVTSDAQAGAAERIIKRIRRRYGIKIKSGELVKATKENYSLAPPGELKKVRKRHWYLRELRALERSCKHYAPILGKKREDSTRKDDDQEVAIFGKATHSIDVDDPTGVADSSTLGEYYADKKAAGLYKVAEKDTSFYTDVDKNLEWICTHELAHGLMAYIEEDFRKAAGYWTDYSTKTGAGEEAYTQYAKTSLGEDLAESVTAYFLKRRDFKKTCPLRFECIDKAVKAWKLPTARAAAATAGAAGAVAGSAAAGAGAGKVPPIAIGGHRR